MRRSAIADVEAGAARDRTAVVTAKPFTSTRRRFGTMAMLLSFGLGIAITLSPSIVAASEPFDLARFEAAQQSGASIVVGIHADWCSVCAVQKRIIARILAKPEFAKAVHFHVDYDRDRDALRRFKVLRQSTIIVFKGTAETGRLVAETSAEKIEASLRSGL